MKWISVKDKLPDEEKVYLVYQVWTYANFINIARWTPDYNGYEEFFKGSAMWYKYDSECGDYEVKGITHWMPLPEPPKD